AKCYLNERKMVITSMNLYEFSQINNREMGILIDKGNPADIEVYEEAWKDIESIIHNATDFSYVDSPKSAAEKTTVKSEKFASDKLPVRKPTGFCIRTGVEIPFDVERPMSLDAFKSWNKYGDPEYSEKYCHFSGELSGGET